MPPKAFIFILLLSHHNTAWSADLALEQRIRDHLKDPTLVGEAMRMRTGETEFLAIHAPSDVPETQGAVILLHDRGANPDWRAVIQPLRTGLPAHGWETLSLQMPVASPDATAGAEHGLIADALPRISLAVDTLVQLNILNIALLGHGLGARMAVHWLAQGHPEEVRAFVAVSLAADPRGHNSSTLADLELIKIPILDIYGSRDAQPVRDTVRHRKAAALEAENRAYRQLSIEGADHLFTGQDGLLLGRIRAWLSRTMAEIKKDIRGKK